MPGNGRKLPKLDYQHAKHLTMVYDMRLKDKPVLRYAYWGPHEWVTNPSKDKALELSIKHNGDDPNWRPPGEFYKEGHILAIDKENVPVPQRTTGSWLDFPCDSSPQHPSRRSRKTKSTRSSSGASSASSGPPSDPAERKVRAALPCPALPCPALPCHYSHSTGHTACRGFCSPVCLPHAQEYEKSQKMKKSQKKRDARSMRKLSKIASLITTGFAHTEEQSDSRAAEVRRAIQTSADVVREDVEKAKEVTKEVLANVIKGHREAAEARLEAEEQRLTDQEAAADKAAEEEQAKQAKRQAKLEEAKAKAKAKRALFEETRAREQVEKAEREAITEAHNVALLASISKEVGAAVEGEVGKVVEAITEVKKVVDNTNEAAVLAADAAVTGASASKDAKEAVEALKCDLPEIVEARLTAAMRKERTMNDLISIVDEKELNEGLAQLKTEVTRLGQQRQQPPPVGQRNAAGTRAGSALVRNSAPAPSTRSGATRSGAAAATTTTTTRKQAAAPRERLPAFKGELATLVRQDVATLSCAKKSEDGAWKVKIDILAKVRRRPLPPAAPRAAVHSRTTRTCTRLLCSAHDPTRAFRWRRCRSCSCGRSRRTSCWRPSPPSSRASPPSWWARRPPTRTSSSPPPSPPSTPSTPRSRPTRRRWSWWRPGWCRRSSR